MKLSTRGEYGLRAMVYLAMKAPESDQMLHAQEISTAQDIPPHYLKQILSRLRAAGLVRSTRGPTGGHALALPADEISVGAVVRCLEGSISGVEGILAMPCNISVGPSHCVIKELLLEVKRRVEEVLEEVTIARMAERQLELVEHSIEVVPRLQATDADGNPLFLCEAAPARRATN